MSASTQLHRPLRVFVVENHADTMKYYSMFLGAAGHEMVHAPDMTEALRMIPSAQCDVLISDVGLPDGSGWELLRRLRDERIPHPAFSIAISGYGTPEDRAETRAAGFRYHLLKPFDPSELARLLEEAAQEVAAQETHSGRNRKSG